MRTGVPPEGRIARLWDLTMVHLMGQFGFFDPKYFLYVGPAILLALWAEVKVKSAYARASKIPAGSGLSGAETAQRILNFHGINNVAIEPANSFLGDHYDSKHKVLRLSPDEIGR